MDVSPPCRVGAVIVNWNARAHTLACLDALRAAVVAPPARLDVIVVDNGSDDGSVEALRAREGVTLLANARNEGFAAAANAGVREALARGADAVLLLNNDTLVDPFFLGPLLAELAGDPAVGAAGPRIEWVRPVGAVWFEGGWTDLTRGRAHHTLPVARRNRTEPCDTSFLTACAMLVRREAFARAGLFDEGYFMYGEDNDFCLRLAAAGFRMRYVPASRVRHHVSAGGSGSHTPQGAYLSARNRILLLRRFGAGRDRLLFPFRFGWEMLLRALRSIRRGRWDVILCTSAGVLAGLTAPRATAASYRPPAWVVRRHAAYRRARARRSARVTALDPYAAFRSPSYRFYVAMRLAAVLGAQTASVAVGWQVYERTDSALALGLVGLAQVLPVLAVAPWAGRLADHADRGRILAATHAVDAVCALALVAVALLTDRAVWPVYAILVAEGIGRGFRSPAVQAIMPSLVPPGALANAVGWRLVCFEAASIAGPLLGGVLIARAGGVAAAYAANALLSLAALAAAARIRPASAPRETAAGAVGDDSLWAGLAYVWRRPVLLGALSLDMFAVLFGGATALFPIFARDILDVGPEGLGFLRAAPSAGSILMTAGLLHRAAIRRAGRTLLLTVAAFGLAMVAFAASRNVYLSVAFLAAAGMFDAVSVLIRHTILQAMTPDAMRGRVSAVNGVFITASNQLGEFESGVAAALLGAAPAVALGGVLTVGVVAFCAWRFPDLRRLARLDAVTAA